MRGAETKEVVLPFGLWLPVRASGDLVGPLRVAYELSLAGDAEGALALVTHLAAERPGEASLVAARAALQRMMGFRRAAEKELTRALALAPDDVDLALGLAQLRLELGFPTAAVEALGRAHYAGRDDVELHRLLGIAWARLGQREDARRHFDAAFSRADELSVELLLEGADVLMTAPCKSRETDEERLWIDGVLERAVVLAPSSARAWLMRGLFHESQGAHAEALEAYERACRSEPWNRVAWTHLALASRKAQDRARFGRALEKALSLEGDRRRAKRLASLARGLEPLVAAGH